MTEQVERLSKLATDLLDLSRLDAGPMRLEQEPVELADVAEDLCEEFAAVARGGGPLLAADVREAGVALGDHERVLQIGRALVDNALLHTPAGTPVRIVARGADLRVEDDGPGIPADEQERVFARFSRLDGSRASGTGLGLAIARELAAPDGRRPRARVAARPDGVHPAPGGVFTGKRAAGYSPLVRAAVLALVCAVLGAVAAIGIGLRRAS